MICFNFKGKQDICTSIKLFGISKIVVRNNSSYSLMIITKILIVVSCFLTLIITIIVIINSVIINMNQLLVICERNCLMRQYVSQIYMINKMMKVSTFLAPTIGYSGMLSFNLQSIISTTMQ